MAAAALLQLPACCHRTLYKIRALHHIMPWHNTACTSWPMWLGSFYFQYIMLTIHIAQVRSRLAYKCLSCLTPSAEVGKLVDVGCIVTADWCCEHNPCRVVCHGKQLLEGVLHFVPCRNLGCVARVLSSAAADSFAPRLGSQYHNYADAWSACELVCRGETSTRMCQAGLCISEAASVPPRRACHN